MAQDLREQLQQSLGTAYTLLQELGGAGMSRVFVAREEALGREVVVKVLPQDVAGVSVDRFKREISTAARLQHPHIVPLLSAGEMNGVPYYTMPFVVGDSLRARLKESGALPIAEATRLLRDIASALAYAHQAGVVHRDIKPDNVLLSGGSAAVTDFGVAKALRDAAASPSGDGALTQIGMAMGTPMYMAPEQAAADPNVDSRADIYAFGVMAYEMFASVPPFHGRPPQELLAAHLTEEPEHVGALRPELPPALAMLVMRCLAKRPDERPQTADEIVTALDDAATPARPTAARRITTMFLGPQGAFEPRGGTPRRAFGLYLAAAALTAGMAKVAVLLFALPDWVFSGAAIVLVLGLPLMALAAWLNRSSATGGAVSGAISGQGSGVRSGPRSGTRSGVTPATSLTWRKASLATAGSLVAYGLFVSGFVMMRALGIGPAASLMAAGKLKDHDRILVADFTSTGPDTSLASVVAEAFRADLRQSRVVSLVQDGQVRQTLARMQRPLTARLDTALAREVAQREGIKAVVSGEIRQVGSSYQLFARLLDAGTGNELVALRETAADGSQIIPAIDRLSKHMREKIGEGLREIRANPPLEQVSTASLEALRQYAAGSRLIDVGGDPGEAIRLLEQAITLDTTFAMAYRKLGIILSNTGIDRPRGDKMLVRALEYSARLPELERYLAQGTYYMNVQNDEKKALSAYRAALALDPDNYIALNNSAITHMGLRQYVEAEGLLRRQMASDSSRPNTGANLVVVLTAQGKIGEGRQLAARQAKRFPESVTSGVVVASLQFLGGQYDSSLAVVADMEKRFPATPANRIGIMIFRAQIEQLRGHLGGARALVRSTMPLTQQLGARVTALDTAVQFALLDGWFLADTAAGRRRLDAALAAVPLATLEPARRPYYNLVTAQALLGRPAAARALLAEHDAAIRDSATLRGEVSARSLAVGTILIAERKYDQAAATIRQGDVGRCAACVLPALGYAYDLAGRRDSAIAVLERYRSMPDLSRVELDAVFLAGSLKRLGELYDAAGAPKKALAAYEAFVALWATADAPLQPQVTEAKRRIEALRAKVGA